jgi:hypothetical protein
MAQPTDRPRTYARRLDRAAFRITTDRRNLIPFSLGWILWNANIDHYRLPDSAGLPLLCT